MRTGAEIIADLIGGWGLGPVFHIPGEGILDILDALAKRQPSVRLVTARHEGGMTYMASGAARASGRMAVCLAARAPGALNTALALHTACTDAVPLLMVVGQAPMSGFEREAFLDTDLHRVFAPLCKWVAMATDPARLPELLSRAAHIATSGRHGPVVLIIPEDVSQAPASVPDLARPKPVEPAPFPSAITEVGLRLARAARPLVLLGGGDWDQASCDAMRAIAARLGLPVATAYRRRDLFDNDDPSFVGEIGIGISPELARRVADSDVILAIGLRLGELNTIGGGFEGWSLLSAPRPKQTLIHVHSDASELNRVYQADLAIQSSPAAFLAALGSISCTPGAGWASWTQSARRERVVFATPVASPAPVDVASICIWMRENLPDDTGIAVGAGAYALWHQRYFAHRRWRTLLGPKSGAMGYGLPAAIGAAIACPERRFVALAGDGCFTMHAEELATAVHEGVRVVTIVFNNAAYGAIRLTQQRRFGRAVGTSLTNPDFAAFARAFGAHGERVTETAAFAPAFLRALAAPGPAVVEVVVPPDATRPP